MRKKLAGLITLLSFGVIASTAVVSSISYASVTAATPLPSEVHVGDVIEVPSTMIGYEGSFKQSESCLVTTPKGYQSLADSTVTFLEAGKYTFTYAAMFGEVKVTKEVEVMSIRRPSDMFTASDATVTSGASFIYPTKLDSYVGSSYEGVRVDSLEGGTVTFNKIVDLSNATKDYPLIDFIVEPSEQGKYDIGVIEVTFTDVEDPTNYVVVRYVDGLLGSGGNLRMTYVTARGADQKSGGYEASFDVWHYDSEQVGTTCGLTLRGLTDYQVQSGGGYLNSTISMDYEDRSVYLTCMLGTRIQTIVNDLDSLRLYSDNPWNGFTTGKVRVSITTKDVGGTGGSYIIHSICDYDLSQEDMKDTDNPEIVVNYGDENPYNLPKSKIGASYPIFPAEVEDFYDDDLPIDIKVTYFDENLQQDVDVDHTDTSFVTSRTGKYRVAYSTKDYAGNTASAYYEVSTVAYTDPFEIVVPDDSKSYEVFDTVMLPSLSEVETKNGCGTVKLSRYLTDPTGKTEELEGDTFEANLIGTYQVSYVATDLLGQTATKTVNYLVHAFEHPTFTGSVSLPERFIYGFTYTLPTLTCKYNEDGQIVDGTYQVYINGALTTASTITIDNTNDYIVRFVPIGDTTNEIDLTIPVINPNDASGKLNKLNYFYSTEGSFTSEQVEDGGSEFTLKDETEVKFANAVSSENFTINMQLNPNDISHYTAFNIVMTDGEDSTKTVTLKIAVEGSNTFLYFPHVETKYSLASSDYEFALYYTSYSHTFSDYLYSSITDVEYFDDGSAFTGFSNSVYFSFYFEDVNHESRVSLLTLNNQSFKTLVPKDNVGPQIILNDDSDWAQERGTTIHVGNAVAYDVLSYVKEIKLSVSDSNGKLLFNNVDATKSYTFILDTYGNYNITYVALDGNGKKTSRYSTICCMEREAPVVQVSSFATTGYTVSSSFTLPGYSFSDNSNNCYLDIILYMPSGKGCLLEHDVCTDGVYTKTSYLDEEHYSSDFVVSSNTFRFLMKGKHRLRYFAHDENGNYTSVEFAIEVL